MPNQAYSIVETQPNAYWTIKSVTCIDDTIGTILTPTPITGGVTVTPTPGQAITCTFLNEKKNPTRTQGFWQTHTEYTSGMFSSKFPTGMLIGSPTRKTIVTREQLFGGYFSNIAKKTDNKQRSPIDKARMQLLQQLITAKLNCVTFGCTSSVTTMIQSADIAYAGSSASDILVSAGALDSYNNSGDSLTIGQAGRATPQVSRSIANKIFWDAP